MKTVLFLITIFFSFRAFPQSYVFVGARVTTVSPVIADARYGYQFTNHVLIEPGMRVCLSNSYSSSARLIMQTGYAFRLSEKTAIAPVVGFGYKLVTTDYDKYHQNQLVWTSGARVTHNWFMGEAVVMNGKLWLSVGLIGWFTNNIKY